MKTIYLLEVTDYECANVIAAFESKEEAERLALDINIHKDSFNTEQKLVSKAMAHWEMDNPYPESRDVDVMEQWSDAYSAKQTLAMAAVKSIYGDKYVPEHLRKYVSDFWGFWYTSSHHNYKIVEMNYYEAK